MRLPRSRGALLERIAIVTLFTFVSAVLLLLANGYMVNWERLRLVETATIALRGQLRDVSITLDGRVVGRNLPLELRFIQPGLSQVTIEKPEFQPWRRSFRLEPGMAGIAGDILVFLKSPRELPTEPTDHRIGGFIDPTLVADGGELYLLTGSERRFVTRFSSPIRSAVLGNDRSHVYVQVERFVLVTELDGANTVTLLELPTEDPARLKVTANDTELRVSQSGVIRNWQIR